MGYPPLPIKDSPPPGFLIGGLNGFWKLYSHNLTGVDLFTGTINTEGTFSRVQLISGESNDQATSVNNHTITFSFHTGGYVDGVKFVTNGGTTLTFKNLKKNGTLVPPSETYLGGTATPATSNPVTFTRSSQSDRRVTKRRPTVPARVVRIAGEGKA